MLTPAQGADNARRRRWRQPIRACAAAAIALGGCALPPSPHGAYPFDGGEFLATPAHWPAWADMLSRRTSQAAAVDACIDDRTACSRRMRSLHVVVGQGANLPREQQIQLVNRFINKRGYESDRRKTFDGEDGKIVRRSHWATLKEFLEQGGDCEDYATAKYFILRRLGFPAARLRVVVAYDRRYREHHAVVAVRQDDGVAWVLETDNHIHRQRKPMDLRYVYAVNEAGVWDHGVTVAGR